MATIAKAYNLQPNEFTKQYKHHLSGFKDWEQKDHADSWMLFPRNIGKRLSLDEVALTNGELYTVLTNKTAKGKQGALVAMVAGTKSETVATILNKISLTKRQAVVEVTLDMANTMDAIVRKSFPKATLVTDRFHVQQLVSEAVQQIRIKYRWQAIDKETQDIKLAQSKKQMFVPFRHRNGDTTKQLLARSRYLLFKPPNKWSLAQQDRATILFEQYPEIETAYKLAMMFRSFYEHNYNPEDAKLKLQQWYEAVQAKHQIKPLNSFLTAMESIQAHETNILNYFNNRSTNASAESFNAKLKNFRSLVRGVTDRKFHLFRIAMLYG